MIRLQQYDIDLLVTCMVVTGIFCHSNIGCTVAALMDTVSVFVSQNARNFPSATLIYKA